VQDPNQKEDELSAVHVKQGFSTTYVNSDEYGSSLSRAANLNPAKIWNSFKDILAKKEDINTFQVGLVMSNQRFSKIVRFRFPTNVFKKSNIFVFETKFVIGTGRAWNFLGNPDPNSRIGTF
jgi:hypothetical protein